LRALNEKLEEDTDYEQQIVHLKHDYGAAFDMKALVHNMLVIPVNFAKYHKEMLAHCKELLEYNKGMVTIDEIKHGKLITSFRTAIEKGDGTLDKEATSHDDLFDMFRMSLQFWR
jgi:hypothetical protein